jgi:hypothetical protein
MAMTKRASLILLGVCITIFVGFGGFIIMLYVIPNFRPMGLSGVYVQSKWMTYVGPEMEQIFQQSNFVIECDRTDVIVRIRKAGYQDQGRVQVFENANGIAFNSMKRTQIDFMQVMDPEGIPYSKIIIREPQGAVSRKAKVYINLKSEHVSAHDATAGYNFILDHGKSSITFEHDDAAADLYIDTLKVFGTGSVNLTKPERTHLQYLDIESSGGNVNCKSEVMRLTKIRGNASVSLGDVQSLDVVGRENRVTAAKVNGNVSFESNGSLSVSGEVLGDIVAHADRRIAISAAKANSLTVLAPEGKGVFSDYREKIPGIDWLVPTGSISIGAITTDAVVGLDAGGVTLGGTGDGKGVIGNVKIEKRHGGMTVNFSRLGGGTLTARVVDGNIRVTGQRGLCDIIASSFGGSNVDVGFAAITAGSRIFIYGSRTPADGGKITITLQATAPAKLGANIYLKGSYSATDATNSAVPTKPGSSTEILNDTLTTFNGGGVRLDLETQGAVRVQNGAL